MILATALGNFAPQAASNAFTAWFLSSAFQISVSAFFAPGCADFGSAASTLAILWNLCRRRHKFHYADIRIMPRLVMAPLVVDVVGAAEVGIIRDVPGMPAAHPVGGSGRALYPAGGGGRGLFP